MLAEWRRLETPSLPEMKRVMRAYKVGKVQKKALKKDRNPTPSAKVNKLRFRTVGFDRKLTIFHFPKEDHGKGGTHRLSRGVSMLYGSIKRPGFL